MDDNTTSVITCSITDAPVVGYHEGNNKMIDNLIKEFNLKKEKPFNNTFNIFIEGDWNDGDYITSDHNYNIDRFRNIYPLLKKIYNAKWRWENKEDYLTEEELDLVDNLPIPYGPEEEIHSIVTIEVKFYSEIDNQIYIVDLKE